MRSLRHCVVLLGILMAGHASAAIFATVWDKAGKKDAEYYVYGIDTDTGKPVWERRLSAEANFAKPVEGGVLVGTDGGTLLLLDLQKGEVLWECRVGQPKEHVNEFRLATPKGFLVSNGESVYWHVSTDGTLLWTLR